MKKTTPYEDDSCVESADIYGEKPPELKGQSMTLESVVKSGLESFILWLADEGHIIPQGLIDEFFEKNGLV